MSRDLTGQSIAITGASSGIGAATALECARAGMDVALAARRADKLEALAADIRKLGRRAIAVACDVDRDADVDRLIAETLATFGRLDAAFANAGYGINVPVMETTEAQMRAIFETNFYGTLRVIRAAVPVMRKAGHGHVIICSSAASEITPPGYGAYSATKASQDSVAAALRAELSDEHIFVTSVHPIGTTTEFLDRVATEAGQRIKGNTPSLFEQTAGQVARAIIRNMRQTRPAAEVWPAPWSRFIAATATALPNLTAKALARRHRQRAATRNTPNQDLRP